MIVAKGFRRVTRSVLRASQTATTFPRVAKEAESLCNVVLIAASVPKCVRSLRMVDSESAQPEYERVEERPDEKV